VIGEYTESVLDSRPSIGLYKEEILVKDVTNHWLASATALDKLYYEEWYASA